MNNAEIVSGAISGTFLARSGWEGLLQRAQIRSAVYLTTPAISKLAVDPGSVNLNDPFAAIGEDSSDVRLSHHKMKDLTIQALRVVQ